MNEYAIVLDLEVDLGGDRKDPSPYNKDNSLVAIGYTYRKINGEPIWNSDGAVTILNVNTSNFTEFNTFRRALKNATYVVAHNAKFDIAWLREIGIECNTKIIDTMISEYVLSKGVRSKLSLDALSQKYDTLRKQSTLADAFSKGLNYSDMSEENQRKYLYFDVMATAEVFEKQEKKFRRTANKSLLPIRDLMCEFCSVLTDIERSGMAIDLSVLDQVDADYQKEQEELTRYLQTETRKLMGDKDINLSSPEQLSTVVYSCNLTDKKLWKEVMDIGVDDKGKPKRRPYMKDEGFRSAFKSCFSVAFKTRAIKCGSCYGKGHYYKVKKNGEKFKKPTKCEYCEGLGVLYLEVDEVAGLRIRPKLELASAGGFKTDKITLTEHLRTTTDPDVKKFLESLIRLSAIDTYRASFIEGIKKGMKSDGLLHSNFNQCITATGRLSSSNPNLQNMPKGRLFPVRKAFVSRFKGGTLVEIDYSQLEFRVAGILATDETVKREVESGFDVHAYTAKVLTDNGEVTDRGAAKASTFRPLYGGTQGTPAQQIYFKEFFGKYQGIFKWHDKLQNEAISTKVVTTATGRQFSFPDCERNRSGNANFKTQIVNYPVQSVATAEIVPLGVILLFNKLKEKGLQSVVINTVHDSVLIDTHPDEIDLVKEIGPQCLLDAQEEAKKRFGLPDYIPLEVEMSCGNNWMDQQDFN
jgi:DNA polymerase I-like protein with 3'-5' exonuclease and polymerase domains